MNITATGLTKAAGAAAAAAGAIFIAVQINHPASDAFTTETTQWVAREWAKIVMAALALAGITGMHLRQHRQAGLLGLVGYLVFAVGYLAMFSVDVIATGDIGGLHILFGLMGAGMILGGLVLGIALVRTRVLARWAAASLAVSTGALAALAVLPESFNRPLAVPVGIALIALTGRPVGHPHGQTPARRLHVSGTAAARRTPAGAPT